MDVEKNFYYCGVYNSEIDDKYPWYFAYEGQFISKNGRHCKFPKAAKFINKKEAIEFFDFWLKKISKEAFTSSTLLLNSNG